MKKIVVFGDLPIATLVVEHIMEDPNVQLVGVVIGNEDPTNNDPWENVPLLTEYADREGIQKFSLEELVGKFQENELYIGFSCRFSKILKKKHIQLFQQGVVNFHGGLLPEFGGLYSSCHTILEGAKIGGGTLHFVNEGIDTGEIIKRAEFEVIEDDTTSTVFRRTQKYLYESFKEVFTDLLENKVNTIKQKDLVKGGYQKRYFDKHSLKRKKMFELSDSPENIDKKVRAFDFPGKEPAYFEINDKRYFVRTNY